MRDTHQNEGRREKGEDWMVNKWNRWMQEKIVEET